MWRLFLRISDSPSMREGAINGETRSSGVEYAPLFEPMIEMSFAGAQENLRLGRQVRSSTMFLC